MSDDAILLATRSSGKLRELLPLFASAGLEVIDLERAGIDELAEEAGVERFDTFEENALAKARYFHHRSGMPVIAEDSGLEVDALEGRPGVRSKRWSGRTDLSGQALDDANNERLIQAMADVRDRRARYVCVAAYVDETRTLLWRGSVEGELLREPRGRGGFGYDPFFFSTELQCSFGEAGLEEKERVSHRGRAMRGLFASLGKGRSD